MASIGGQVFKLGATGDWFSKKGSVNAFWVKVSVEPEAKVSVEPDRKPELRKSVISTFVGSICGRGNERFRESI